MEKDESLAVAGREDFDRRVLQSPTPVLVDFGADWCGPCRMVEPIIDGLAAEYGERLAVAKVDIEAHPELASKYQVRSIPTVMLIADGAVRQVLVGTRSAQVYRAAIDALLH